MAKPYGQYETLVRNRINDSTPEYRWTSQIVLGHISDAVKYLRSIRPEARYDGLTLSPEPTYPDVTDLSAEAIASAQATVLSVVARWEDGIVYYAAAKCLEMDSADTANAAISNDFFTKAVAIFQT